MTTFQIRILRNNVELLIELLLEENSTCQRELVETLTYQYYLTYSQAREILKAISDDSKIYWCVRLFNRIINRHLRYDLIQLLPTIESKTIAMNYLGQAFNFNYYNPTGHYRLKLSNKPEKEVAQTLLMFNKMYRLLVQQGDIADRSRNGNKSCFRNEKLGGVSFVYQENFILPDHEVFECDFVYLLNPPHKDEQTSEDIIDMIKDLILTMEGNIDNQITSFRALSEYLVLSWDQLGGLVELIDDPNWKTECFIAGVGRTYDIK